jgi:hypothetical protein
MGNSASEVQSKMPMDIIAFADNARNQMECRGKMAFPLRLPGISEIASPGAEWCRKIVAALRRCKPMGLPSDHQLVNSLFQITVLMPPAVGTQLAAKNAWMSPGRRRIRADKVESSVSVSGALSLLTSFKRGHRGGRRRALQKSASEAIRRQTRDPGERIAATENAPTDKRKQYRLWLDNAVTGLWVALLLSIIAYTLVEGEAVLAQLDGLDLVAAYSASP